MPFKLKVARDQTFASSVKLRLEFSGVLLHMPACPNFTNFLYVSRGKMSQVNRVINKGYSIVENKENVPKSVVSNGKF